MRKSQNKLHHKFCKVKDPTQTEQLQEKLKSLRNADTNFIENFAKIAS